MFSITLYFQSCRRPNKVHFLTWHWNAEISMTLFKCVLLWIKEKNKDMISRRNYLSLKPSIFLFTSEFCKIWFWKLWKFSIIQLQNNDFYCNLHYLMLHLAVDPQRQHFVQEWRQILYWELVSILVGTLWDLQQCSQALERPKPSLSSFHGMMDFCGPGPAVASGPLSGATSISLHLQEACIGAGYATE